MIEGKGLGGKRVNRMNMSLTNKEEADLQKLATSCGFKYKATLAHKILVQCLYDSSFVNELQKEYCTQSAYRVVLVNNEGEIHYTLSGREDI